MKFVSIPKKTQGEYRQICVPNAEEKNIFRSYLTMLNKKAEQLCDSESVHGFMPQKSPVTNAKKHIGFRFTLKFDLSNFFDTVKPKQLDGVLTKEELEILMPSGRAYQGLPTSPIIANLAAKSLDAAILKMIKKQKIECVYTRYADDLCFSFNDYEIVSVLKQKIPQIIGRCGFTLNKKKTWLQDSKFGNRHITGVMVSSDGVGASRKTKRKLRAAEHQKNTNQAKGLSEWCKMKTPSKEPKKKIQQRDMKILTKLWKIQRVNVNFLPEKEPDIEFEFEGEKFLITGDPVQIMGLSNFTTNWTSCMRHPTGQYHKGAAFWAFLKGTRIAGIVGKNTLKYGPFERPVFKTRALIHTFEDGVVMFDRIYSEDNHLGVLAAKFRRAMKTQNIFDITNISVSIRSNYVIGQVSSQSIRSKPYPDNLILKKIQKKDNDVFRVKR
jgi:hypothetical protein